MRWLINGALPLVRHFDETLDLWYLPCWQGVKRFPRASQVFQASEHFISLISTMDLKPQWFASKTEGCLTLVTQLFMKPLNSQIFNQTYMNISWSLNALLNSSCEGALPVMPCHPSSLKAKKKISCWCQVRLPFSIKSFEVQNFQISFSKYWKTIIIIRKCY